MSFLGYGNIVPNSNINSAYVNSNSSTYSGSFSSNEIPGLPGLSGAKSGIDAAAGKVPGVCMSGGRKIRKLKPRIKNITNIYKMRHSRRRGTHRLKRRSRAMTCIRCVKRRRYYSSTRNASRQVRRNRYQRGGYSQYENNMPVSAGYSLGGNLSASNSALANPPMYKSYNNAIDNYNHYTGKGFDSIGH